MKDSLKKVGIVTIQGRSNYGNRLQNYASSELIKDAGCRPVSLVLDRSSDAIAQLRIALKKVLGKYEPPVEDSMSPERLAAFDRFNEHIDFEVVDYRSLRRLQNFDFYCVGSDQVWRFGKFGFGEDWAYLQFAGKEKRIALAPSLGVDTITGAESRRLKRYVEGFEKLSIREERGAEIIEEASGRKVEVLCDPTLGLAPNRWREVSSSTLTPRDPYVLVYMLGDKTREVSTLVKEWSLDGALQVICLSDRERSGEPPAGPAEFLSLIDCAQHVITDSFHASLFSALFSTPLTIVRRNGGKSAHSNMFGRIETLTRKLGIEHMVFGSASYDPARAYDFRGVSENIGRERRKLVSYLEECLNG